jgi:peptide-methionine (S)-S-oxide reductase
MATIKHRKQANGVTRCTAIVDLILRNARRPIPILAALAVGLGAVALNQSWLFAADAPTNIVAPIIDNPKTVGAPQTAVLAGGCFWGVQGVFEHVRGVKNVLAGYAGGDRATAHYGIVGLGKSGHAESVKITFDPSEVSYGEILQIAFSVVIDPTQENGQGPDIGSEYRSVVFYSDDAQRRIAQAYIRQLTKSQVFSRPIVTGIRPLKGFYQAEDYHQDFMINNPDYPYIAMIDLPKIASLRRLFPQRYSERPVKALN